MANKVFKLIPKKYETENGTSFTQYQLLTANGHWYKISAPREVALLFDQYARQVVVCDVLRCYNKRAKNSDNTYRTLVINSIALAEGKELETYNKQEEDYNAASLADL